MSSILVLFSLFYSKQRQSYFLFSVFAAEQLLVQKLYFI